MLGERAAQHDLGGLAAELAYRFFLALFPFTIFLTALGALLRRWLGLADPSADLVRLFGSVLPAAVATLVEAELRRIVDRPDAGLLSFGAVAAVAIATGGTNAMLKAVLRAYGSDRRRPFWRSYAVAFALTVLGGWLVLGLFVLFVGLQVGGARLAAALGVEDLWRLLVVWRWLLAVPALVVVAATLYRLGTPLRPPWRGVLTGAAVFAAAWLAVTWLFALYVDRLAGYTATYGTLAGVAGLLVWLYLSAFLILFGAEVVGYWLAIDRSGRRGPNRGAERPDASSRRTTRPR